MDEKQKKEVAVFRFGVIADFVTGAELERGDKMRLLKEKSARKWRIPFSNRTRIAVGTMQDWIDRYTSAGGKLEALYPRQRADSGRSRSIDDETAANLVQLRQQRCTAGCRRAVARWLSSTPKRPLPATRRRCRPAPGSPSHHRGS